MVTWLHAFCQVHIMLAPSQAAYANSLPSKCHACVCMQAAAILVSIATIPPSALLAA